MKDLINEDSVVEDEFYKVFKDSIICPLCLDVLIEPVMCMRCQNVYCKNCTNDWLKKDNKCPNRCNDPNYKKCIGKNDILSKLRFKCKKCGQIVNYNDCNKHKDVSLIMESFEIIDSNSIDKIRKLTDQEINKAKEEGKKITYITSK